MNDDKTVFIPGQPLTNLKESLAMRPLSENSTFLVPLDAYELSVAMPVNIGRGSNVPSFTLFDEAATADYTAKELQVGRWVSLRGLRGVIENVKITEYDCNCNFIITKDLSVEILRKYDIETNARLEARLVSDGYIRLRSPYKLLQDVANDQLALQALMLALLPNEVRSDIQEAFPEGTKHGVTYGFALARTLVTHATEANWLFGAYLLDFIGITEHGGSVYSSWLDDTHAGLMELVEWKQTPVLNTLSDVKFFPPPAVRLPYTELGLDFCSIAITPAWDVVYTPVADKDVPKLNVILEPIDADGSRGYWSITPAGEVLEDYDGDESDNIQSDILHLCCCGNPDTSLGYVAHMLRLFYDAKGDFTTIDLNERQTWMGEVRLFAHYGSLVDVGLIDFTAMAITPKGIAVHDRIVAHLLTNEED